MNPYQQDRVEASGSVLARDQYHQDQWNKAFEAGRIAGREEAYVAMEGEANALEGAFDDAMQWMSEQPLAPDEESPIERFSAGAEEIEDIGTVRLFNERGDDSVGIPDRTYLAFHPAENIVVCTREEWDERTTTG